LPTPLLERRLDRCPAQLRDLVFELRNLIAAVAPDVTGTVLWEDLAYFNPKVGGPIKGAICQIAILRDHVRLAFVRGAFLPDPKGLLEGKGRSKYKRHINLRSYDTARWSYLRELVAPSYRLDPYSLRTPRHAECAWSPGACRSRRADV
jgi:hypothetical protein